MQQQHGPNGPKIPAEGDSLDRAIAPGTELEVRAAKIIPSYPEGELGRTGAPARDIYPWCFTIEGPLVPGQSILKGMSGKKRLLLRPGGVDFDSELAATRALAAHFAPAVPDSHPRVLEGLSKMEYAEICAVQIAAIKIFGVPSPDSLRANDGLYESVAERHLGDFKGADLAMCTEYALYGHQLLNGLGQPSIFVSGHGGSSGDIHSYLIVPLPQECALVYDVACPHHVDAATFRARLTHLNQEELSRFKGREVVKGYSLI
jgi:hypothetical protein